MCLGLISVPDILYPPVEFHGDCPEKSNGTDPTLDQLFVFTTHVPVEVALVEYKAILPVEVENPTILESIWLIISSTKFVENKSLWLLGPNTTEKEM